MQPGGYSLHRGAQSQPARSFQRGSINQVLVVPLSPSPPWLVAQRLRPRPHQSRPALVPEEDAAVAQHCRVEVSDRGERTKEERRGDSLVGGGEGG